MVTDRPDITESSSIVPSGWLQLETGAALEREPGSSTTLAVPGTLLRIGLGGRVEGRLAWDGLQSLHTEAELASPPGGDRTGVSDGEASLKVLLVERRRGIPDLALLPSLTLPVGDEGFGGGRADPGLKAILADDVISGVGWGANVGVAWPTVGKDGTRERRRLASWSLSFGFDLGRASGAFLEYFGEDGEEEPAEHSLDAGFTHLISPNVQLDASGGVGLAEAAPDWFVGAGFSFRTKL